MDSDQRIAPPDRKTSSESGFGYLLSSLLRYGYESSKTELGENRTFTDYVEGIAAKADGLSPRQLARLRTSSKLPGQGMLERLAKAVPQLKPLAERPISVARLTWDVVEWEQEQLPKSSTITLVLSVPPRAIGEDGESFARRMAINIHEKNITYSLLYPLLESGSTRHLDWVNTLRRKVLGQAVQLDDFRDMNADISLLEGRVNSHICLFETEGSVETTYFWSRAPRYAALYNIGAEEPAFASHGFGMFWDHGELPYPSVRTGEKIPAPIDVEGWTYLTKIDYEEYSSSILLLQKKGFLVSKEQCRFPIPTTEQPHERHDTESRTPEEK